MDTQIPKPTTMRIQETRTALVNLINNSGLPLYVIEPMIRDLSSECSRQLEFLTHQETSQYHQATMQNKNSEEKDLVD